MFKLSYVNSFTNIILFFSLTSLNYASGFAVKEQSALLQGSSYAGATTSTTDSSSLFFNSANLAYIDDSINVDFGLIVPKTKAQHINVSNVLGSNIQTNGHQNFFFNTALIPSFSVAKKINHKFSVGLSVNSSFGFINEYEKNWFGKYHALNSELKTLAINPIISYKPFDKLSFAIGQKINYATAKLSQAVDNTSLYVLTAAKVASLGGIPLAQSIASDGYAQVQGDDWGYGLTAGLLYQIMPSTRIGLSYQSKINHKLKGTSYYSNIDPFSASINQLQNSSISAKLSLPASLNFGISQQINDTFKVMADLSWTEWSSFDEIRIVSSNGAKDSVTTQNWQNSMFYALGGEYRVSDKLTLRSGFAYEETPTTDSYRTARIPDSNRYWGSLGMSYVYNQDLSFNIGYSHLWLDKASVKLTATALNENNTKGNLSADYNNSIDILMISTSYVF